MPEFIKENFKYLMENYGEKIALLGIVLMLLGGAVFLGATPRGYRANGIGDAWMLALALMGVGLSLFGLNWFWNR